MKKFVLLALLATTPLFAQQTAKPPWVTLKIGSAILGDTRTIYVATPAGYDNATRRFPVLVLLDADDQDQFTSAVANVRFLAGRGAIPELILVGIVNGKDRGHDLTPASTAANAKNNPRAGGASAFVDFITREVLPTVRTRYRTLPSVFLEGHSIGGLLALHAASTRRDFAGIIAISPSLWWNDSTAALGYADSLEHLSHPLRLFIGSGELEQPISVPTQRMVAHLDSVKPRWLSYTYRYYHGANHGLTPLLGLIDGVQYLFEPMSVAHLPIARLGPNTDSADVMRAYIASRDTYVAGARSLGFDVNALPEDQVNHLAYGVLQILQLPHLAVWLFRENTRDYPRSSEVYYGLADGLLAEGDTTSAIAQLRRGLNVARTGGQADTAKARTKLAELERHRVTTP